MTDPVPGRASPAAGHALGTDLLPVVVAFAGLGDVDRLWASMRFPARRDGSESVE
ncbi:hypothetical protein [Rhodococcus koreensis]|uniref:hypothetical protein n=1 Tax=Rhodococcus koreensis TaxID=99653 RepID=UPI00366EA8FE